MQGWWARRHFRRVASGPAWVTFDPCHRAIRADRLLVISEAVAGAPAPCVGQKPSADATRWPPALPTRGILYMAATDVSDPRYYHKVVDCQWACPAHTNVPGYLRLIAQGRYDDSYLLNRESNVFPGILGRTCDRPCEPACRRAPRGRKAGRDLPPQARGRRPARRHHRPAPQGAGAEERQADRPRRCRPCLAHGGERPAPARLRRHDLREERPAGRTDADQHPVVPPAGPSARRRVRLHHRHGGHHEVRHPGRQHEGAARRGV